MGTTLMVVYLFEILNYLDSIARCQIVNINDDI